MSTTLSAADIYEVARQAGFSGDQAVTWTAIALAESGGNAAAHNPNGEQSWGLWQINVAPDVRPNKWGDLTDPLTNARAAYEVSGGGQNLRPWTVTHAANEGTPRDYRRFMDEAREAADGTYAGNFAGVAGYHDTSPPAASSAPEAPEPSASPQTFELGGREYVQPVPGADLIDSWHAPRSGGRVHQGIDIFADEGTPMHAIASGRIVRGFEGGPLGGVVVRIEGDDGRYYYYAHLQEDSTDHLQVGQHVEAGELIGAVGKTGNAATTPPHLHLQIKENGDWINPYDFLQDLPDADTPEVLAPPTGPDSDQDGISDYDEIEQGTDPEDADTDDDGLLDGDELRRFGSDPLRIDSDGDGLSDAYEIAKLGTDPSQADTDLDGLRDDLEVAEGRDPLHGTRLASAVHALDPDAPEARADTDADGLTDAYETALGLDPESADTDLDGLADALEIDYGTDPLSRDTDADGLGDLQEIDFGLDPFTADLQLEPVGGDPHAGHDHGSHDHSHPDGDDALTG